MTDCTVTDHPDYGTFEGVLVNAPPDWPWWLIGRPGVKAPAHDIVVVHYSYVTRKDEGE